MGFTDKLFFVLMFAGVASSIIYLSMAIFYLSDIFEFDINLMTTLLFFTLFCFLATFLIFMVCGGDD